MPQQAHHHHLTEIQFDGDPVTVIEREDGDHLVAMKPICEVLELDWDSHRKLINRDPVLSSTTVIMTVVAKDGRTREMVCLPLQFLNGWLFKVDVSRYEGDRRDKLIRYQRECYEALHQHFFRGRLSPEAMEEADEYEREIERQIKRVNNIHKKQDTVKKAVERVIKGESALEDYRTAPDLAAEIRGKIEEEWSVQSKAIEEAERMVDGIVEHGLGWDSVDYQRKQEKLWFNLPKTLERLWGMGFKLDRSKVIAGLHEMPGCMPHRSHRFPNDPKSTRRSKKAWVIDLPSERANRLEVVK